MQSVVKHVLLSLDICGHVAFARYPSEVTPTLVVDVTVFVDVVAFGFDNSSSMSLLPGLFEVDAGLFSSLATRSGSSVCSKALRSPAEP